MKHVFEKLLAGLFYFAVTAGGATSAIAGELPHFSKCDLTAIDESAVSTVAALPEFKAKASDVKPLDLTFADFGLSSVEIGGHCGTSVSVYVNQPDRLEMWRTFFVDSQSHAVTYATGSDGTFIKLDASRSSDK